MTFSSDVAYWGNAVLNHKEMNQQVCYDFLTLKLSDNKVDEETIKSLNSEFRLLFSNHYVQTSHFINFINTNRLASGQKGNFFHYLLIYIRQLYPNAPFMESIKDETSLMRLFNKCYETIEKLFLHSLDNNNLETLKNNMGLINRIFKFYSILEDFMIRFYGYSIVGISNQKRIITACSNCDKKFIDQLMEGYSLFRLQKVGLVSDAKDPYYEFYPVLPTKDVGFPFEEYIEISGKDNRIENKRLIKIN